MKPDHSSDGAGTDGASAQLWSRRALLGAGGIAGVNALTGCGASRVPKRPPTLPTPPLTSLPSPSPTGPPPWDQLSSAVAGNLALPNSPSPSSYDTVRLTENPRFDSARPLAVLSVAAGDAGVQDVQAAIRFARSHSVPLAIRSGGHSYAGLSSGGTPPALVIDLRALNAVKLGDSQATLGSGVALAAAYAGLAAGGKAIAGGSCATVGLGGLALGGGVGVLTRQFGLTCDSLTAVQIVNAEGAVVTASADENADLFWALRGGGGRLGVVTSFTTKTYPAPTVHTFYRRWSATAVPQVIAAWQDWINGSSPLLWSTLKLLGGAKHSGGPSLMVSGTWIGTASSNPLSRLLAQCPAPAGSSNATMTYGQAMASYAGCANTPVAQCHTGAGGALQREALAATSHVASTVLPSAGIHALAQTIANTPTSLKEAGISIDSLGGVADSLGADDTAWPHRGALFTVQYTATVVNPSIIESAQAWAQHLRAAMTPWWGDAAYVNYIDPTLPSSAYFGSHLSRLQEIKKAHDPSGVFGASW